MSGFHIVQEFGVERNFRANVHLGYIKYGGATNDGCAMFWEQVDNKILITMIEIGTSTEASFFLDLPPHICTSDIIGISAYVSDEIYLVLKKPLRIAVYKGTVYSHMICVHSKYEKLNPTGIFISERKILVTAEPGWLLIVDEISGNIVVAIDSSKQGLTKPSFASASKIFSDNEDAFYVVDSSHQIVLCYSESGEVVWSYGRYDYAGCSDSLLNSPYTVAELDNRIILADQRNHRVLLISKTGKLIYQWGKPNEVGTINNRLWSPNAFVFNDSLYIAVCKGACISIYCARMFNSKLVTIFGENSLKSSIFNYQRSCYYDEKSKEIIISDTYHNRVLGINIRGEIKFVLSQLTCGCLLWPRSAVLNDNKLYVADSRHQRIIICNKKLEILKIIDLSQYCESNQMIQSIEVSDDDLLIAFETHVIIFNLAIGQCKFDSRTLVEDLCDAHHATYMRDKIVVSDAGNGRVVVLSYDSVRIINTLLYKGNRICLLKPKCCLYKENQLYIVDSTKSVIYIIDPANNEIIDIIGRGRGCGSLAFSKPRWISNGPNGGVLVSDTDNHRILLIEKFG